MAYLFYLDKIQLPVTPGKVVIESKNQNKTMQLINSGEINVLRQPGLRSVAFDMLLPNKKYPFAQYEGGFQRAGVYLEKLEALKKSQAPFQFIITRSMPRGGTLNSTNIRVSLEELKITEDAEDGLDVLVSVSLREYKDYGTKRYSTADGQGQGQVISERSQDASQTPAPKAATSYTVGKGDSLWNIAKLTYGDGSQYQRILEANKDKIKNPALIYPGQTLILPVN